MSVRPGRLRPAEWIAAAGAVLLLVSLFFLKWYELSGDGAFFTRSSFAAAFLDAAQADGWESHAILRWFMLVVIVGALVVAVSTALTETPAIPMALIPPLAGLAVLTTVLLAYRVLLDEPGPNEIVAVKPGAWIGLAACAIAAAGLWLGMRIEGGPLPDVPPRLRRLPEPPAAAG